MLGTFYLYMNLWICFYSFFLLFLFLHLIWWMYFPHYIYFLFFCPIFSGTFLLPTEVIFIEILFHQCYAFSFDFTLHSTFHIVYFFSSLSLYRDIYTSIDMFDAKALSTYIVSFVFRSFYLFVNTFIPFHHVSPSLCSIHL